MAWKIEWEPKALKEFGKLGHDTRKRIQRYLKEKIIAAENPFILGDALTADKRGLWRYRVGDYRIICRIDAEIVTIIVLRIAHRREVYDD
jgi:mRNA interferase RelE/StbE